MKKKSFRFNSKKTNFFNKKVQDLTVGETLAYGAVASVLAIGVSLIPFAVLDKMEKKSESNVGIELWKDTNFINTSEDEEEVEEI